MKLEDFHIVYINLSKREERRQHIENQLDNIGLLDQSIRFNAVDGSKLSPAKQNEMKSRFKTLAKKEDRIIGRIGCFLSHKRVLECALEAGVDNILILEDDCVFHQNVQKDKELNIPNDALMFYLGGLFWKQNPETQNQIDENKQKDWIRINREHLKLACGFSYGIVGRQNIIKVLEILHSVKPTAIDILYINHIQKDYPCYVSNPVMTYQSNQFLSDVSHIGQKTPSKPCGNTYTYQ